MEPQPLPDSGHSPPPSREIECENTSLASDDPQRVRLLCSYGGRIQLRPHDNQLAYVGGETKILSVDRSICFPAFVFRLTAFLPGNFCLKYQLPGEDLDSLISVTNDEDLEYMMREYDLLLRNGSRPIARLRLFLFPIGITAGPVAPEQSPDRQWFVPVPVKTPPLQTDSVSIATEAASGPDFLFGFDNGVQVSDPAPDPAVLEDRPIGEDSVAVSTAEIQTQFQDLQIATRQTSAAYWPEHHVPPLPSRYGSLEPLYLIPVSGVYPDGTYYAAMSSAEAYRAAAAAMYSAGAPPPPVNVGFAGAQQQGAAPPPVNVGFGGAQQQGAAAYDSAGLAVYYTGSVVPTYQAVTSVGPLNPVVEGNNVVKSQPVSSTGPLAD